MALRAKKLIQRFPLPLYHRTKVVDTNNSPWGGDENTTMTIVTEVAQECTLQAVKRQELSSEQEGLSINDIFILRTNTPVYAPVEGTDFIGSGIYIPPSYFVPEGSTFIPPNVGGYYNVVEVKVWNNGVINHIEAMIVRDYTVEVGYYPEDKVTATAVDMNTLAKLKAGDWTTGWTA